MGRDVRVTALFASAADANAYFETHTDEGVIAEIHEVVFAAKIHDLGRPR
jgi:hypothetical protein